MIVWPTGRPFELEVVASGTTPFGYYEKKGARRRPGGPK
jgi:hypothetical protein